MDYQEGQAAVAEIFFVLKALQKVFVYVTVGDEKTCSECAGFDGQLFTEDEAEAVFPYLEKDSTVWFPHVHPNCRCRLIMQFQHEKYEKYEMLPPKAFPQHCLASLDSLLLSPSIDEANAVEGGEWQN